MPWASEAERSTLSRHEPVLVLRRTEDRRDPAVPARDQFVRRLSEPGCRIDER